jgi:hypothetical protein
VEAEADIRALAFLVVLVEAAALQEIAHLRLEALALRVKDLLVVKALIFPVFGKVAEAEAVQAQ